MRSLVPLALATLLSPVGAPQAHAAVCQPWTYTAAPTVKLTAYSPSAVDTSIMLPPDTIVTGVYVITSDTYPTNGPTRRAANQTGEQVYITIGGQRVGGLTADVPEVAPDGNEYAASIGTTVFAGNVTASGRVTVVHGGDTSSPNSVLPQFVQVTTGCPVVDTTTTSSTVADATTTTSAAPPTSTTDTAGPTTLPPTTTGVAVGEPPTPSVQLPIPPVVTVPRPTGGALPSTGPADVIWPLALAVLLAGAYLRLLARRPRLNPANRGRGLDGLVDDVIGGAK